MRKRQNFFVQVLRQSLITALSGLFLIHTMNTIYWHLGRKQMNADFSKKYDGVNR